MKEKKPLVSVIIPTYKREDKLLNCLESVRNSTYKNLEIIVVNDDPQTSVAHIAGKYGKVIQHKQQTLQTYARNEAAKVAKGDLFFFVDDDNILR